MLSRNSVIRPRREALGEEAGDGGPLPLARPAAAQAFCPAWATSTWPMAETLDAGDVGFVAER